MTESDEARGREPCRMRTFMIEGGRRRSQGRHNRQHGIAGMVLDPLAEIGSGVFMAVVVSRGQDMVYFQDRGKRRENDQDHSHRDGHE